MRKRYILFFSFILLVTCTAVGATCDCGSVDENSPCSGTSIVVSVQADDINGPGSQDSVFEWYFNSGGGPAFCGQFANGDFWIAPYAEESNVTVSNISGSKSVSVDADPVLESMGLLDGSNNYGNYNSDENIIPQLPLSFDNTTSLVAALQRDEQVEGNCGTNAIVGECVDAYNVLTVLDFVPKNAGSDMIRPNITGNNKEFLTFDDFDLSRLPQKDYFEGNDASQLELIRSRWSYSTEVLSMVSSSNGLNTTFSEAGRAFRAHNLVDDYASGVAVSLGDTLIKFFSEDNSIKEKKPAIAALLAYGLDIYHAKFDADTERLWGSGAGQHSGRFLPPVFLAALARDTKYADTLSRESQYIHDSVANGPQELAQVHLGYSGPIWGDDPVYLLPVQYHGAYWGSLLKSQCYDGASGTCNPGGGAKNQVDPYGYVDGPPNQPGTSYMGVTLGTKRSFAAFMVLWPEFRNIVNYEPLIDYVKRTNDQGILTDPDPCVTPDSREDLETCDVYRNLNCQYYGITWGPVNVNDMNSDCIKTPTEPYNKVGRFTSLNNSDIDYVYQNWSIDDNWDVIMSESANNSDIGLADVNQDAVINSIDASLVLRKSLGFDMTTTAWQESASAGDVDCNDSTNSTDALLIFRYSLGLDMSGTQWCG